MNLLSKARQINRLLQRTGGQSVSFMEMSGVLSDVIAANIYVISRRGKILGCGIVQKNTGAEVTCLDQRRIPEAYNRYLMEMKETTSNIIQPVGGIFENSCMTVVPIIGGGDRMGTLLLIRYDQQFVDDDLILAEYGSTVVGMEILREKAEQAEEEARNRAIVQMAIGSLSYSELEAVEHIFDELEGKEGLLVASRIADKAGITRSVIVNALRKLESAGVIESRSLGMKGTFIKVLNKRLLPALEKAKSTL